MLETKKEIEARESSICPACHYSKQKGSLVCWNCFKYIANPYKYSALSFKEWLKEIK